MFSCFYCAFRTIEWRKLTKHTFDCHSSVPGFSFRCCLAGCVRTYSTYSALQSHINRKHSASDVPDTSLFGRLVEPEPLLLTASSLSSTDPMGCGLEDDMHIITVDGDQHDQTACFSEAETGEDESMDETEVTGDLQTAAARFLLALKEQHRLTQVSINFLVDQVRLIVAGVVADVENAVKSKLASEGVTTIIHGCFRNVNPFEGLETEYKQSKFYKEHFNLVEPSTIMLGDMDCNDSFQYVPLFPGLRGLLYNDAVFDEVVRSHKRSDSFMADVCDGKLHGSHQLYMVDENALQLILYFDEIEPFNNLGSASGKYKLGMFYYTLGNFRPELRSTHRAVQLVACVTSPNLKRYGFEAILKPFIEDVRTLNRDGLTIFRNGQQYIFHGTVLLALADTQAAHQLGGYKEGVGFSLRKCRDCMATFTDMQTKFTEDQLQLRCPAMYDHQCALLNGPLCDYDSTTYGINYRSPLNDIPGFHAANNQLPQDIMHVLFEGVVPLELKLMLQEFVIRKKYFDIKFLNSRIESFTYGKKEQRNKPPKDISIETLRLSASQMWSFCTYLPLIIGDRVPDEDPMWECFALLLEIVKYCTARITSSSSADYVAALVDQHHRDFKKCYPGTNFTPKLHYMVHLPRLMKLIGPLVNCWCMRMEAKNSFFKRVAQIGNYRNVPYSVSARHQRLLCAYLQGPFFTYEDLECGPCKASQISYLLGDTYQEEVCHLIPYIDLSSMVSRPNWIKIYGEEFHPSCFIHYDWDDSLPLFGRVIEILIVADLPMLAVENYRTERKDSHLCSYLVSRTFKQSVVYLPTLQSRYPVYAHTYLGDRKLYIALKSHIEKCI